MRVVASSAINKNHRIYHRYGCKYASRIKYDNRLEMSYEQASKKHYKACKCCSGFKGLLNVYKKSFEEFAVKNNISFTYNEEQNSLFVKTEMGFWKIYNPLDYSYSRSYILYHRNSSSPNMTVEQGIKGAFHRQSDVKVTTSLDAIVKYIVRHDRAKVVMMNDYRKLPKDNKKQKQYYRIAEKKDRKKKMKNLYSIFEALESANPDLKRYSVG